MITKNLNSQLHTANSFTLGVKNLFRLLCILTLLSCTFSGCQKDAEDTSILCLEEFLSLTGEAETMLTQATENNVKKNYFPFGQKEEEKDDQKVYIILCRVKNIAPETEYYAPITVWEDEKGIHAIEGEQAADVFNKEYRALYDERRPVKTIDEYSMSDILADEALIDAYKQSHGYLSDLLFHDTDDTSLLCQIGYSYVWNVLGIRYREDDSMVLFEDVPVQAWNAFAQAEDKDAFFRKNISPYYTIRETQDQVDLSEYVKIKN